jgi:hypothetical protein
MTTYHIQKKLERLNAVKHGKWRNKEGQMFDLYNQQQVPDAYLYTIISDCDKREKRDKLGIDAEIRDLLTNIYKNRQNKHMNTHQLELFHDNSAATMSAAVDASTKINMEKPSKPQMFKIGQVVKNKEILGAEQTNKGVAKGWSYTVKDHKTGKIYKIKQSVLLPKNKSKAKSEVKPVKASKPAKTKKKAKKNTKASNDTTKEQSTVIKTDFPIIRLIVGKEGKNRYIVDSRYNKNYKAGGTEFFDDSSLAFDRAKNIAETAKKNQEEAGKTFDYVMETASAKTETPVALPTPPNEKQVNEYISSMPLSAKLKLFFKNII